MDWQKKYMKINRIKNSVVKQGLNSYPINLLGRFFNVGFEGGQRLAVLGLCGLG